MPIALQPFDSSVPLSVGALELPKERGIGAGKPSNVDNVSQLLLRALIVKGMDREQADAHPAREPQNMRQMARRDALNMERSRQGVVELMNRGVEVATPWVVADLCTR